VTVGVLDDRVHRRLLDADAGPTPVDRSRVQQLVRDEAPLAAGSLADRVVDEVLSRIEGLGPLDDLLDDAEVSEIMVNGDGRVWVERHGAVESTGRCLDRATTSLLIERIVTPLGLRIDRSSPIVDARLPDGSRVNAVVAPLAVDGPCLTIRRFRVRAVPLSELCGPSVVAVLRRLVTNGANVIVSGGSGAGKTTLLNALAAELDPTERVITVEDAAELRLPGDHVVRLEARPANADGVGAVSVRDLLRNALRMRPDRVIVGEVRGAEAFDLVQACNTGHDGTLSTCHANTPVDTLRRLESLALMADVALPLGAVREQLHSGLDAVVHMVRIAGGGRRVAAVAEIATDSSGDRVRALVENDRCVGEPTRLGRRSPSPAR
jgi:pilus assembly protein CpaF